MRVLIVEDNEDSRNLLAKQLRSYGNEVTAVADGVEALEAALKDPPDILVSDILMPRMDGYQLCYDWRRNARLKDIPFVFYTAIYTSPQDEKFALSLGASHFIRKPTEPEALAKILSQVLEQAREGRLPRVEAAPLKPSLYLTEYNKRLVAKLNEKVAELEKSGEELRYLGSVLEAIQDINQLIVRESDKTQLLKNACRILHKVREYRFVWIGLIEEGTEKVIPVAKAGVEDGYLDAVEVTWDESQHGQGPTGVAIKTAKPDLMRNIKTDPRAEPWREEALKRGYRSSAAIPLVHGDQVYGALNVYSSQSDGFIDAEVGMLVEVSSDIAFALKAIEEEAARRDAEYFLKERMKETRCLYTVETIGTKPRLRLDEIYREVVKALPAGWQYPEITAARLVLDGRVFKTKNYRDSQWKQSAEVKVNEVKVGEVEVVYLEEKPKFDEGPFLKEERQLINSVAVQLAGIIERRRAEAALRDSEARYRAVIEGAHDMIQSIGADGRIIFVNKAWLNTLGYTEAELSSLNLFDIIHPESMAHCQELFKRVMSGKPVRDIEATFLAKDGRKVLVEGSAAPRYIGDKAVATQGIFRDVTDRKQAEVALRESEAFQSSLLLKSPIPINVINPDGSLRYVNPALEKLTGFSTEELLWRKPPFPYWPEERHQKIMADLKKSMRRGAKGLVELYQKKGGERFWVEITSAPVKKDGEFQYLLGSWVDITERKQAEEALRESEEKIRELAESITDVFFALDKDLRCIYWNKASENFTGISAQDALGKHCHECFPASETIQEVEKIFRKALRTKKVHRFVTGFRMEDKDFFFEINAYPSKDGLSVFAKDITERKQAEEALRESEEKIRELAESITDIFFAFDKNLRYTYWNKASEQLTGVSAKDALGKHLYDIFPETVETKRAERMYLKALKTHKVQNFVNNFQLGGKDYIFEINAYPSKDGLSIFVKDITERKQAEEALQAEQNRMQSLIAAMEYTLTIQDKSFNIIFQNESSRQASGGDHVGEKCYRVYEGRDTVCDGCPVALAFKDGKSHVAERQRLEPTGEITFWENTANPIRDAKGEITSCLELARDITERKKAEDALRESNQRFTDIAENALQLIWEVDAEGKYTYVSPVIEQILGYKPEEVIGKYFYDMFHPDDREELKQAAFAAFADKEPFRYFLNRNVHRNGDIIWLSTSGVPIVDKDGNLLGYRGADIDITERRQAEEALRESEEKYKTLTEDAPLAIYYNDFKGTFLYGNKRAEEITGYKREELIGKSFLDLKMLDAKEMPKAAKLLALNRLGRATGPDQFTLNRKDGTKSIVEIRTQIATVGGRKVVLGMVEDITERKQAEDALRENEAFQASLLNNSPITINAINPDTSVRFINPAMVKLTGFPAKKLASEKAPYSYWPEGADEAIMKGFKKAMRHGGKQVLESFRKANGEKFWVEITSVPVKKDGKFQYLLANWVDVTERKNAEDALRESEAKYRAVVEGAHDMIQSVGLDGRIIFVNKAWLDTLGYTEDELPELSLDDIIHPDSMEHCRELFKEVAGGQSIHVREVTFVAKDGHKVLIEGNAAPRYVGDKVVATQGIFRDITERKQAEAALADEATRHRILIDESSDGIVILDEKGKVFEANRRFAEMLGYTPEEVLKLNVWDWEADFPPEQVAEMIASIGPEGDHFETRHRRKDGTTYDVEISTNGAVYAGKKLIFCVVRDITDRKLAEAAVKESEAKYKTLVEATSDIIWEADERGVFTFISPRIKDVLGYEVEEVVGKMRTLDFAPEDEAKKWLKRFKEVSSKRKPFFGFEMTHLHKNGRPVICEVSGIPLFDSGGNFKGFVGINRDITSRKKMQEQLVITDRLASVGELAAGIAHELNNPLTGVIGFSQLLMDKEIPGDIKEDVEVVYSEAQRAAQVVKNLLTFARKHAAAKQMLNINDVIEKVLELRAYEQRVENIKVKSKLAGDLPEVMADYFQLQQVFLNIIINAEFFMREAHNGGTLTITTERVDNKVKAYFADDGPGIAKDDLGHLFDPFFTTKEVGKGTGLGLSICHGIIAEHGGNIYVESEPGKGATFIVELPISAADKKGKEHEK